MKCGLKGWTWLGWGFFVLALMACHRDAENAPPPLLEARAIHGREYPDWDEIYVPEDQDMIFLRKGPDLFTLRVPEGTPPVKSGSLPLLNGAKVFQSSFLGDKQWLFFNAGRQGPFALEVKSGKIVEFHVPGVVTGGEVNPVIQSCQISYPAQAAVLAVSGGEERTWPRKYNHSVYFWMDLKSGRTRMFPIGWDLNYYTQDQGQAIFHKVQEEAFQRRPEQAIDMKTGAEVAGLPNRREVSYIYYDWQENGPIHYLLRRRPGKAEIDDITGLCVRGRPIAFPPLKEGESYVASAKSRGDFLGFREQIHGKAYMEPAVLWILPLAEGSERCRVAEGVIDFVLLDNGDCVYVTGKSDPGGERGKKEEAFYWSLKGRQSWNLLEGIEGAPKLELTLPIKRSVWDGTSVRLIEGFGQSSGPAKVYAIFQSRQYDPNATMYGYMPPLLKSWDQAMVVQSGGSRYLTSLPEEANRPDELWFHESGKLFRGDTRWRRPEGNPGLKIDLAETIFQFFEKPVP